MSHLIGAIPFGPRTAHDDVIEKLSAELSTIGVRIDAAANRGDVDTYQELTQRKQTLHTLIARQQTQRDNSYRASLVAPMIERQAGAAYVKALREELVVVEHALSQYGRFKTLDARLASMKSLEQQAKNPYSGIQIDMEERRKVNEEVRLRDEARARLRVIREELHQLDPPEPHIEKLNAQLAGIGPAIESFRAQAAGYDRVGSYERSLSVEKSIQELQRSRPGLESELARRQRERDLWLEQQQETANVEEV